MPVRHFVGRERELASVQARLHEASLGSGSFLIVAGVAGAGKSRFLRACADLHSAATVLSAQCSPSAATGRNVRMQLGEQLAALGFRARAGAAQPFHATLGALLKRRTAAVLVDDVHLAAPADLETLDAIASLVRRQRLVLIACVLEDIACVPRSVPARVRQWTSQGAECLHLGALDDAAIELLVRTLVNADGATRSGERIAEILEVAQGNPRFAIELAVHPTAASHPGTLVPESARSAIAAARHELSKNAVDAFSIGSVIGERFHDEWIARILGAPRSAVATALQEACDAGILCEDDAAPGWFFFRQNALRNAAYAAMVSLKRRLLHERVAEHLGTTSGDAFHARLLGLQHEALSRREEACAWLGRAAVELHRSGAYAAAADAYARAASNTGAGSATWLALRRAEVECHLRVGEYARMVAVGASIRAVSDVANDLEANVPTLWNLFLASLNDGDFAAARATAAELVAAKPPGDPDLANKAALILVYVLWCIGRRDEALATFRSVDPATLASEEGRFRYLISKAITASHNSKLAVCLADLEVAATAMPTTAPVESATFSYIEAAYLSVQHGDIEGARSYGSRAVAAAAGSKTLDNKATRHATRAQALLHIFDGRLAAARELLLATLTWRNSGRHNEAGLAAQCVFVGMRVGDFALVDAMFDHELLAAAVASGDAELTAMLLAGFAEVMQARGLTRELQAVVAHCLDQELSDPYGWTGLTMARYAPPADLDRVQSQHAAFFGSFVAPIAQAHMALVAAIVARRRGALRVANERAREAAERFGRSGWRLFEAFALEEGDDHGAAVRMYRACGADADVARLVAGQTRKRKRSPFGAQLTPREREVARLIARKRSDKDIARALEISVRTVHHHAEAVFSKLGVSGRAAITAALVEDSIAR